MLSTPGKRDPRRGRGVRLAMTRDPTRPRGEGGVVGVSGEVRSPQVAPKRSYGHLTSFMIDQLYHILTICSYTKVNDFPKPLLGSIRWTPSNSHLHRMGSNCDSAFVHDLSH